MKVQNHLDEERWRTFVDTHPQGNIFHTPEIFHVFDSAKGLKPTLWVTLDASGEVLALLPLVRVDVKPHIGFLTARNVAYGGVLCQSSPEGHEALSLLLQTYTSQQDHGVLYTELRNLADTSSIQPILTPYGFEYKAHLNFLIDIDLPKEAILNNIKRRTRKRIQKGIRKKEVNIREAHSIEQLEDCYQLLQRSYSLAQVPLADRSLFEAVFNILRPAGKALFTVAYVDQVPAATSVELLYKDVMYGWYGGVNRDFSSYVPNELLIWDLLAWGADRNYKIYDFGGAGEPDQDYGVRRFKAKFGGDLVCFGRNTFVHHPIFLPLSRLGYEVLRRIG
jgi:lipid II:glycine glycyltransferase (peptidoglycan interpeptide bridge formation enzyme)